MPYYVYVVSLDEARLRADYGGHVPQRIRNQNPQMDWRAALPAGTCFFYVGQSAHAPECRFAQHKECHGTKIRFSCICPRIRRRQIITTRRSNKYVRLYGRTLVRRLYVELNPIRWRINAEDREGWLADQLRQEGHVVYFN